MEGAANVERAVRSAQLESGREGVRFASFSATATVRARDPCMLLLAVMLRLPANASWLQLSSLIALGWLLLVGSQGSLAGWKGCHRPT